MIDLVVFAAFALSLAAAIALVLTRTWHERFTGDPNTGGIQKHHVGAPPRVGLLPILAGLLGAVTWLMAGGETADRLDAGGMLGTLLLCAIPAAGLGLLEDLTKRVSPKQRMLGAAVSATLAWWLLGAEVSRVDIPGIDTLLEFTPLAFLLTLLMVAGFTNAMNIIDGLNGLAGGLTVVMTAATGAIAWAVGDTALVTLCLVLGAAVLGFLVLNFPRGLMFMGDGGAYLIGFLMVELWVLLCVRNPEVTVWVATLIGFLPTMETIFSILRRKFIHRRKANAMAPDRLHLHSLLYRRRTLHLFKQLPPHGRWMPNALAALALVSLAAVPAAAATLVMRSMPMAAVLFVCAVTAYLLGFMRLTRLRHASLPSAAHEQPGRQASGQLIDLRAAQRPALATPAGTADASEPGMQLQGTANVLLFANTGWYLYNFRRSLAESLRRDGYNVVLASPPDEYGPRLQALGFKWVAVPMQRRSVNPLRELVLLRWLVQLMQREQIDLVHSFTLKCAIYGSLAGRMAGVQGRINAVAGLGYTFTSNSIKARTIRFIANSMMRVALGGSGVKLVLQNPDDAEVFQRLGVLALDQFALIAGSGVNCDRFKPNPLHVRGDQLRVLLPARILWDKGVAEFVEAARLVRQRGGGVKFLLAGAPDAGNPTAVPEAALRGWQLEGLVEWLGHVDDMATLYRSVDVVALPSYREGLPKGLIEAGACGLPLITTDVPGCRHVVEHGRNGLLVPAREAGPLSDAIMRLRDDAALCEVLGREARRDVLARFDERIVLRQTRDVYGELLEQPNRAGALERAA